MSSINSDLKKINQKILAEGETIPSIKLQDGIEVQTGTVATMLHNIRLYNKNQSVTLEEELEASIPILIHIGLFELFCPNEWCNTDNLGRRFIGQKAKEYMNN